jgi:Bacterial membrane protein YfhO
LLRQLAGWRRGFGRRWSPAEASTPDTSRENGRARLAGLTAQLRRVHFPRIALLAIAARVAFVAWIAILEIAAPLVAILAAPLFYWRLLVASPQDAATLLTGDVTELHYPIRRWVAQQLARDEVPLWNPYVGGGHSAIGDIQFHTLYRPDALLAQYFGGGFPLRALEIGVVAHVALGALFTYLLARRLTRSRVGGLVASTVFAFGGYLAGFPVQQVILLETSVWLPLALLCVDVGADYNLVLGFVAAAGPLALAALAGHPQTFFYVVLATVLCALFKGWNGGRVRLAALPGVVVAVFGGVALAAPALVPAYYHLALTDRTDVTYAFSSTGFSLRESLGLVFPTQFGGAALYHGIFTLVLVAIALGTPFRRGNKRFWIGLGLLGLLLSFGGNTFLEGPVYLALGSFKFRDYERLSFFVSVAAAILAGYGAAEVARQGGARLGGVIRALRWPLAGLLVFLVLLVVGFAATPNIDRTGLAVVTDRAAFTALVLGLGWAILIARDRQVLGPAVAGLLIVGLVGLDLFTTNWQNNLKPGDPSKLLAPSPIVEYLESYATGQFRISSEGLLPADGNAGMLFRLDDVVINSPLETRDYAEFDKTIPELTRWQVLNVRYVVTQRKLDDPRFQLLREDGKSNLYELDSKFRLPHAFVVRQVVPAPSHEVALDLLKQENPATTAIVEGAAPGALPSSLLALSPSATPTPAPSADARPADAETIRVSGDEATGLTVDVNLTAPGFLVVSDVEYPGWSASLDGVATPLYRADGIVRGVSVPAGRHAVAFAFDPPGLATGNAVSVQVPLLLRDVVVLELAAYALWFLGRAVIRLARWGRRVRARRPLAAAVET